MKKLFFLIIGILIILISFTAKDFLAEIKTQNLKNDELENLKEQEINNESIDNSSSFNNNPVYPDLIGWITIPNTVVDYPVMYSPERPDYYLGHNYKGEESISGTPYLSSFCFKGCRNYIIYAHNMKDGSMFKSVADYRDYSFYLEHQKVFFSYGNTTKEYEIISAFYTCADMDSNDYFNYYDFYDLTNQELYDEYYSSVSNRAIYKTHVKKNGKELLTLSTCSYHTNNGRFVVVCQEK